MELFDIGVEQITYKLSLETVKELMARELKVPVEQIEIRYVIDHLLGPMDRGPGVPRVVSIEAIVDTKKQK